MRDIDRQALCNRHTNNICQVVLALRVLIGQPRKPSFEPMCRRRHDARIDLVDCSLLCTRIFVLNDGTNLPLRITHNAPIACWIRENFCQHSQALSARSKQCTQGFWLDQWHIAIKHDGHIVIAILLQERDGL